MKILVIAERMPSLLGGGSIRQYNLLRQLSERHEFTVVANAFPEDLNFRSELATILTNLELNQIEPPARQNHSRTYWLWNAWKHAIFDLHPTRGRLFNREGLKRLVVDLLTKNQFDLVQVHQAYMMASLPGRTPPVILDMHDILSEVEHQAIAQKTRRTHRFQARLEWKKMQHEESKAIRRARIVTVVSDFDQQKLGEIDPTANTVVVTNGVDCNYFVPGLGPQKIDPHHLVFTGSMNYEPNAKGIKWFYQSVLPIIENSFPGCHCTFAGWQPPPEIQAYHNPPQIQVTGYVADIRPILESSSVVIVPIHAGSGTRLKILEAWAMARPVVSTTLGAQGLQAVHGVNILLADSTDEFAAAVIHLLNDPVLREYLGQAGRKTVKSCYSWDMIARQMEVAYQLAVAAN